MNKRSLLLMFILLLSLTTTVSAASDAIKAKLFQATIYINKFIIQADERTTLLNYNDRVYVPLRKLTEITGAAIGYDSKSRSIYIDQPQAFSVKSSVHRKASNDSFTLHIYSEKAEYAQGESIRIWSRLVNESEQSVTIYHAQPLVGYNIVDEEDSADNQIYALSLTETTFNSEDEYNSSLLPIHSISYNVRKLDLEDFNKYIDQSARPSMLPKGTYTVTAEAPYSLSKSFSEENKRKLQASITIKVV
ncbi:MAG: stalk domain-containing protein [Candidatus Cohnella colombiensis]|uniref:Stalk domain-containing protein n=1 Tax=Candidatus Cohnella colombiensis TaxID=3121368 RepID=A0AA95F0C3_9BACL|nr:MAG: stalk domain-containing protein [Cohnella sp.]